MGKADDIITTFVYTAALDGLLQIAIRKKLTIRGFVEPDADWVIALKPYFERHTPLSAMLIAGMTGAGAQLIIYSLLGIETMPLLNINTSSSSDVMSWIKFMMVTATVSAALGVAMDASGIFPHLSQTYYKQLGRERTMELDMYSGLIVNTVFAALPLTLL